jgi:hypothetical protein
MLILLFVATLVVSALAIAWGSRLAQGWGRAQRRDDSPAQLGVLRTQSLAPPGLPIARSSSAALQEATGPQRRVPLGG